MFMNVLLKRRTVRTAAALALGSTLLGGCAARRNADREPAAGAGRGAAPQPDAARLYARGTKTYEAGDRAGAVADLEAAVAAAPRMIMARERLGDAYKDADRYDDALRQYQELTQLDPLGPTSWYKLGVAQQLAGQRDPAAASYARALRLDANDWRSRMNLGLVKLTQWNVSEAVADTKRATEVAPTEAEPWHNHGTALDAAGRPDEAEQAYRKALELRPDGAATMVNLGQNLIGQGKSAEAVGILEQAVRAEDSAVARRLYGDALKAQNREADAQEQYRKAEELQRAGRAS